MKILLTSVFALALAGSAFGASVAKRSPETVAASDTGEEIQIGPSYQPHLTKDGVQGMLNMMNNANLPGLEGPLQGLLGAFNSPGDIQGVIQGALQLLSGQGGNPLEGLQGFLKTFISELSDRQTKFGGIATDRLMKNSQDVSDFIEGHTDIIGDIITVGIKSAQSAFQLFTNLIGHFLATFGRRLGTVVSSVTKFIQEDVGNLFKAVSSTNIEEPITAAFNAASKFISRFQSDFTNVQSRLGDDVQLAQKNLPVPAIPGLPDPQELLGGILGGGAAGGEGGIGASLSGIPVIGDVLKTIIPGAAGASAGDGASSSSGSSGAEPGFKLHVNAEEDDSANTYSADDSDYKKK